jgi:MerR family copper efflux transcriptional regulator
MRATGSTDAEVHTLRFIRRARDLGFSMAEIAELLKLWQNRGAPAPT